MRSSMRETGMPSLFERTSIGAPSSWMVQIPTSEHPQSDTRLTPSSSCTRVTTCGAMGAPPQTKARNDERSRVEPCLASARSSANGVAETVQVIRSTSIMSRRRLASQLSW